MVAISLRSQCFQRVMVHLMCFCHRRFLFLSIIPSPKMTLAVQTVISRTLDKIKTWTVSQCFCIIIGFYCLCVSIGLDYGSPQTVISTNQDFDAYMRDTLARGWDDTVKGPMWGWYQMIHLCSTHSSKTTSGGIDMTYLKYQALIRTHVFDAYMRDTLARGWDDTVTVPM